MSIMKVIHQVTKNDRWSTINSMLHHMLEITCPTKYMLKGLQRDLLAFF